MSTLNLGILAHVDAGKTTLTERLLHAAGVIVEVGSVDDGSTQTESTA
jgi:ribosomal protection tetracycline resistance protein